jgi:hypothetical protein
VAADVKALGAAQFDVFVNISAFEQAGWSLSTMARGLASFDVGQDRRGKTSAINPKAS